MVARVTLEALVRPEALARLSGGNVDFCPTADCSTVYFTDDQALHQNDVSVPVFQKQAAGDRVVCYCLGIQENRIREEVESTGLSSSAARIRALVHSGECRCEVVNPQGTCCLGQGSAIERAAAGTPSDEAVSVEPGGVA